MKKTNLLLFLALFVALHLNAQQGLKIQPVQTGTFLPAYQVTVGWDHTTALVFPAKVLSVDRGHQRILAKVEEKAPNLLLLKAGQRDFIPTNLHVVTADARLYHFRLSYGESLQRSSIAISSLSVQRNMVLEDFPVNEEMLRELGRKVFESPSFMNRKKGKYSLKFRLEGIYQHSGLLFFKLSLRNRSRLAYVPKALSFAVTDRKQAKNTSLREQFMEPALEEWEWARGVEGKDENTLVLAFSRFTLSDKKHFKIYLKEENGDRDLELSVRSRDILNVRNLTNVQPKNQ
ncbi:hypothetical protein GCM10028791_33420 [Echinicola sediminis]